MSRRAIGVLTGLAMVMGLFSVAVASHNAPLIEEIDDRVVEVGETEVISLSVSPPEGADELSISISEEPDFVSLDEAAQEITVAPQEGDEGTYGPITVTVTATQTGELNPPEFRDESSEAITSAEGTALVIQRPIDVESGDLLLAQVRYRGNDDPGLTAEGWQELDSIFPGNAQSNHTVLYRIAGESEPEEYQFIQNIDVDDTGGRMAGGIGVYSGVDPLEPIEAVANSGQDFTETLVAPDLTTSVDNTRVVRLWGWRSPSADEPGVGFNSPDNAEERWSEQTGNAAADRNRILAADEIQAEAGPVGESTASGAIATEQDERNAFTVALAPHRVGGTAQTSFSLTVEPESTTTTTTTTTVPTQPPEDHFTDDDGHLFEADINAIASAGITRGCNPPENTWFCPDDSVTRGQMAAFLVRALGYTDDGGGDLFVDDDDSVFEGDIDRLATAGVTRGCNPPTNDRFCPDENLTRGQMAAFLVRALGYTDDGGGDLFVDDDDSVFEGDIDRLATAGVTRGCNPPTNDRFCPDEDLTRGQMAAFLARALIYNR